MEFRGKEACGREKVEVVGEELKEHSGISSWQDQSVDYSFPASDVLSLRIIR